MSWFNLQFSVFSFTSFLIRARAAREQLRSRTCSLIRNRPFTDKGDAAQATWLPPRTDRFLFSSLLHLETNLPVWLTGSFKAKLEMCLFWIVDMKRRSFRPGQTFIKWFQWITDSEDLIWILDRAAETTTFLKSAQVHWSVVVLLNLEKFLFTRGRDRH